MKLAFLYILAFILLFIGCQKELSSNNSPISLPPVPANSILLKQYIKLDTLHSPSHDTTNKYEFNYDNLKRLTEFAYTDYDTATGVPYGTYKVSFSYNASDSLPQSSTAHLLFGDYPCLYKYDTQGRLIYKKEVGRILYDPGAPTIDTIVSVIHYNPSAQVTEQKNYHGGQLLYIDTTTETNFSSSNNINKFSYINIGSSRLDYSYNYVMTFDSHNNPLRSASILFKLFPLSFEQYGTSFLGGDVNYMKFASQYPGDIVNSVMTFIYNGATKYSDSLNSTYSYNSNGYPITGKYNMNEFGTQRRYAGKTLYFYTN